MNLDNLERACKMPRNTIANDILTAFGGEIQEQDMAEFMEICIENYVAYQKLEDDNDKFIFEDDSYFILKRVRNVH